jgi:hypothetical protein
LTRDSPRYAESSTACSVSSKTSCSDTPKPAAEACPRLRPRVVYGWPGADSWPRILRPARTPLCACSTPPRSAADLTQHPRSRSGRAIAVRPRSRPGPYDALRARRAQPRCDMHTVQPSAKTSSTNTSTGARPADVAAAYSEANEQTLDAWRAETGSMGGHRHRRWGHRVSAGLSSQQLTFIRR